jgi:sugar phosphate isomerase/epimerase
MHLSGFADEAADDIDGQIRATRTLGWTRIEARKVGAGNIHDLPEAEFETVCGRLADAGVTVDCFGSAIGNWSKSITGDFAICLAEARRAVPRMQRLGTSQIRLMSYPRVPGRAVTDDQFEGERCRRLRTLVKLFADAGIQALHENCANFGGLGWTFTQRLLDHVRGLKLVFDTGNPVTSEDFSGPAAPDGRRPRQSSWEFYRQVREHVLRVHIKDAIWDDAAGQARYTLPGEGQGDVVRILADLLDRGYAGALSIEPHLAVQAHDPSVVAPPALRFDGYVAYGRRLEALLAGLPSSR